MKTLPNLVQRAFTAGELAPALGARADLALYNLGAKTLRNFLIQRQGGVANRTGTQFIAEVKYSDTPTLLYKWSFTAADQSTLIEVGERYMRFYQNGERLTVSDVEAYSGATAYVPGDLASSGGVNYYCHTATTGNAPPDTDYWHALTDDIYEIPSPYPSGAFNSPGRMRFVQDGAILTITHTGFAVRELVNDDVLGAETNPRWVLRFAEFGPHVDAPADLAVVAGVTGTQTKTYVVTAVDGETGEESEPSEPFMLEDCSVATEEAPHQLTWIGTVGASHYEVYCDPHQNGTFGHIGTATDLESFNDVGFAPDFARTPPQPRDIFWQTYDYPEMCAHFQQRRLFAYTDFQPATVWGSRTGYLSNFSTRNPLQDDDAVEFTISSRDMNVIRHLIALQDLVLLTESGAFLVRGNADGVLTPFAINLDQHTYIGASRVPPAIIGNAIIYVQARETLVRELRFDRDTQSSIGGRDLTLYAGHLFDGYTMTALAEQLSPHPIVWAVRSDGTLLSMTYLADEDAFGWTRHDTGASGAFEDVCVIGEEDGDRVYVLVQREIDGDVKRYIERFALRPALTDENWSAESFFVDCGISYVGESTDTITGLDHLEGESVVALAGGVVRTGLTVSGGEVTLPAAVSEAHVGLAITADLETVDLDVHGTSIRDKRKRIQSITALLEASRGGFRAGPDVDSLVLHKRELYRAATGLLTGAEEVNLKSTFNDTGRVVIRHTDPTPLTILGLIPRFEAGG